MHWYFLITMKLFVTFEADEYIHGSILAENILAIKLYKMHKIFTRICVFGYIS